MKENVENNEQFFNLHFQFKQQGFDLKGIREAVKSAMGITNDHFYRARLSALANPNRYQGRFVGIREFMKNQKTPIHVIVEPGTMTISEIMTSEKVGEVQTA